MAAQHWETLQLDPRQIEIAADFFESYASFAQSSRDNTSENSLVDTASSLRAAAQWAMIIDVQRAMELFQASARIWHQLGHGYGTFLLAAFAPQQLNRREMVDRLSQLVRPSTPDQTGLAEEQQASGPLLHPQQQAYLLLAETGMSHQMDLPLETLRSFADQSPHRRGVAPIGSLGTPLRVYWDIARNFLNEDEEGTAALVARDLAQMATSYAEAINSAMANQRLWFNAAAPVDVGDADTVALAMIAARRLGFRVTRTHLQSTANGLEPIARVPIELAIEMIELREPPLYA
jgi:hypothetical protein